MRPGRASTRQEALRCVTFPGGYGPSARRANRVLTRTSQARHQRRQASLEVRDLLTDDLSTLETLDSDESPCNVYRTEVVLPPRICSLQ